jgi:Protein of unknown function (DUF3800)
MALLFYVDESADAHHHLHLGLLADGDQTACAEVALHQVRVEVLALLKERRDKTGHSTYLVPGLATHDLELHAYEILGGKGVWEQLTVDQRISIMDRILAVLTSCGVEVIYRGTAILNFEADRGTHEEPHRLMFSNLLERLNERSQERGHRSLVIADENHAKEAALRQQLTGGQRWGTSGYRGQVLTHIIDTVHFVDSKLSSMVQLADAAAFIVRKQLGPSPKDARAQEVFERQAAVVFNAVPAPQGKYGTIWRPS